MVSHPLARSAGPLMARYPLLVRRLGIAITHQVQDGRFPRHAFRLYLLINGRTAGV